MKHRVAGLIVLAGITFAAAATGSVFTSQTVHTWYADLAKPSWTPPGWLFGPVWTLLYGMMAVAAWLVWLRRRTGTKTGRGALVLWAAQLVLNAGWPAVFFGLRMPGVALGELAALWAVVLATTIAFWRVRAVAGVLMVPYLGWTTFAGALNLAIWRLNA